MRCSPVLVGALADGELRGWRAWRVRRHLAHCPACQQELTALEGLNQTLGQVSPLPARQPIPRPIGTVRPTLAALALACTAAALVVRLQVPLEAELPQETPRPVAVPVRPSPPSPRQVALVPPHAVVSKMPSSAPRHVRRKRYRRPIAVAKATPPPKPETEQIIVIATVMPPPEPVTVVLDNNDDDGGTIHIESTIPAAYVVAMQKEQN
ncbi:anti-sigma factor family protein [Armatimonas rosea]|uniref:Anti-sigma factor RsiW n=1 Tax=Armatimonas rosea TaxID=685828 RepID=A0A7W9W5W6_ARMRO|nr:zf-HC2 domain-containing protein [Armatimonas rosea]MBB6049501.1 anti-sigma factor RsiW [Armatimonas rosea]